MDTINLVAFITGRNEKVETEAYDDNNDQDLRGLSLREIMRIHWDNWTNFPRHNPRKGTPFKCGDFLKASLISCLG